VANCLSCCALLRGEQRKFCSNSCSASFNNKGVRRHGAERFCAHCTTKITSAKFCSNACQGLFRMAEAEKLLAVSGKFTSQVAARKYLILKFGLKCWQCEITEWNGGELPVVLDHIDGNSGDNGVGNVRLLCCNCDAQTGTYKGRNRGNGRHARMERYRAGKSY
jgi:hypothetical protein